MITRLPTDADRVRETLRPSEQSVVMRQEWLNLLFLHWRISPESVQATLPPGLFCDTFDGDAYIGLVPFEMRRVRPAFCPSVPGLSHFAEINVRTYVHDAHGRPGVWFYSLDAANPVAVAIARAAFHLPYFHAAMLVHLEQMNKLRGTRPIEYVSQRRHPGTKSTETALRYAPTGTVRRAAPGTLDHFLCERYVLFSERNGALFAGRVHHTPYPLRSVTLLDLSDTLVAAAGFPGIADDPPAHSAFAAGVSVEIFPLHRV